MYKLLPRLYDQMRQFMARIQKVMRSRRPPWCNVRVNSSWLQLGSKRLWLWLWLWLHEATQDAPPL